MESKYTELEKWKQLKDNGDITEEEYNAEKQRILNSKEVNANSKPKRKGIKVITLLIIIIVIIGVIAAIVITANLNDKIQYERIEITTNEGITLPVNKTNLDKGIAEIEKQLSVANTIGIVYSGNNIMFYLIPTFDSSKSEVTSSWDYYGNTDNLRKYTIYTVYNSGTVVNYIPKKDKFLVASTYSLEGVLEMAGTFYIPDEYEILIVSYTNGNIKIINDQTISIKNTREEFKTLTSIEKAKRLCSIDDRGEDESHLKQLYAGTLYLFYDSWEDCLEDFRKANLLIENKLKGKTYKNEDSTITLKFIDDNTLEINNQAKYEYEFYGDSFEIIYGETDSHLCWIREDGKIDYYNEFLAEVK